MDEDDDIRDFEAKNEEKSLTNVYEWFISSKCIIDKGWWTAWVGCMCLHVLKLIYIER